MRFCRCLILLLTKIVCLSCHQDFVKNAFRNKKCLTYLGMLLLRRQVFFAFFLLKVCRQKILHIWVLKRCPYSFYKPCNSLPAAYILHSEYHLQILCPICN